MLVYCQNRPSGTHWCLKIQDRPTLYSISADSPLCLVATALMPSGISVSPTLEVTKTNCIVKVKFHQFFTSTCVMDSVLTRDGVFDLCDVSKVGGVRDSQTAHTMSVPPLLKTQNKIQHLISQALKHDFHSDIYRTSGCLQNLRILPLSQ